MNYQEQAKMLDDTANLCERIVPLMAGTFRDSVVSLMDNLNFTIESLSEASQVGTSAIKHIRNDISYRPSYKTLVALCIGMKLPPSVSRLLIAQSGTRPIAGYKADMLYETMLNMYWNKSIYEVNQLLKLMGVPTLTKPKEE